MIGTKIQECTELTNPTGEEKIPVSDGTGKAKVVKFKNISTTTQAIANANAAASAASSATSDVNSKISQLNSALSSAQTQLQAMRAATEDAQDAIESAETATTGANTAKTNANKAANNANQAATNANNAYNTLSGLISQINGIQSALTQLQTAVATQSAQAVTFNSGNTLPTAVTKKQIFQNTQTQKTYIGVPGGQTTYDFFYNAYLGHVEITLNQQFTVRDKSGNQGVFICKTRGGVLNLVEDGEIQENLCMANNLQYGWTVRGTSDPDAIKAEYETVNNPDYWKEI